MSKEKKSMTYYEVNSSIDTLVTKLLESKNIDYQDDLDEEILALIQNLTIQVYEEIEYKNKIENETIKTNFTNSIGTYRRPEKVDEKKVREKIWLDALLPTVVSCGFIMVFLHLLVLNEGFGVFHYEAFKLIQSYNKDFLIALAYISFIVFFPAIAVLFYKISERKERRAHEASAKLVAEVMKLHATINEMILNEGANAASKSLQDSEENESESNLEDDASSQIASTTNN